MQSLTRLALTAALSAVVDAASLGQIELEAMKKAGYPRKLSVTVSTHLALHSQNCFVQEMVRAFYFGWYGDVVDGLPLLENGQLTVGNTPGNGIELRASVLERADCHRRITTASDL